MLVCMSNHCSVHIEYWLFGLYVQMCYTTSLLVSKYFLHWLASGYYLLNLITSLLDYKVQHLFYNIIHGNMQYQLQFHTQIYPVNVALNLHYRDIMEGYYFKYALVTHFEVKYCWFGIAVVYSLFSFSHWLFCFTLSVFAHSYIHWIYPSSEPWYIFT